MPDDLNDLQLGQLIDRVPPGYSWLLRSTFEMEQEQGFFAHVFYLPSVNADGDYAYGASPEEAFRNSLRALT